MSDIQRYTWDAFSEWQPSENGDMVLYAEHVAETEDEYDRGISDERSRIRQAVNEMRVLGGAYSGEMVSKATLMKIIAGEEES